MSTRKPALAEPDRRYLRRRANQRVRKARLAQRMLRWSSVVAVNMLIGGMLLYAGVRIFRQITTTQEFALQRVEVEGTLRASAAGIRQRLEPFRNHNLLDLNLSEVASRSAEDPWVLLASAKRVLPETLRITITERKPCMLAPIGGVVHVVDETGYVIGPADAATEGRFPLVVGFDGLNDDELRTSLRQSVEMIRRLQARAGDWVASISAVDISRHDRIVVRTVDPGPLLLLDPDRIERNLSRYLELRHQIERRVGTLEYVDLRWEDQISVMPVQESERQVKHG